MTEPSMNPDELQRFEEDVVQDSGDDRIDVPASEAEIVTPEDAPNPFPVPTPD